MKLSGISRLFAGKPKILSERVIQKTGTTITQFQQGVDTFTRVNFGRNAAAEKAGLVSLLKGVDKKGNKFIEATFRDTRGNDFVTRSMDTIDSIFRSLRINPHWSKNLAIGKGKLLEMLHGTVVKKLG